MNYKKNLVKSRKYKNYNKNYLIKKTRKGHKKNNKKSYRKSIKKNYKKKKLSNKFRNKLKGGFGPGSCPFVTPPPAWNATGYSHFFPLSKNGVSPGGTPAFPGDKLFQNGGGLMPQSLVNGYRLGENFGSNLLNRFQGLDLNPSVLPMFDQFNANELIN